MTVGNYIEIPNNFSACYAIPGLKRERETVKKVPFKRKVKLGGKTTISEIEKKVCEYYEIPVENIHKRNRSRANVLCRQVIIYFARQKTNLSSVQMGNFFDRDHTTALSSIKVIEDLIITDSSVRKDIEFLKTKI